MDAPPPEATGGRRILVGRVAGGFGVRGEVRITAYTEAPERLLEFRTLLKADGSPGLTLQSGRVAKDGVIARCPEIASKEAADALRGLRLYVPREALGPTDEDEFYLADLIGLTAQTAGGEPLGRIKAVHDFGAGDILELDPGDGRPTRLIPFTREAVPDIDLASGRLTLVPPVEIDDDQARESSARDIEDA